MVVDGLAGYVLDALAGFGALELITALCRRRAGSPHASLPTVSGPGDVAPVRQDRRRAAARPFDLMPGQQVDVTDFEITIRGRTTSVR